MRISSKLIESRLLFVCGKFQSAAANALVVLVNGDPVVLPGAAAPALRAAFGRLSRSARFASLDHRLISVTPPGSKVREAAKNVRGVMDDGALQS